MRAWGLASAAWLLAAPLRPAVLSDFSCQRPRPVDSGTWHNVSVAAQALNGISLTPGAQLSFTQAMQPLWDNNEFRQGRTLFGGKVVMSKGGGYCQVSTALYNAALLAGLSIIERHTHSFYDVEDAYVQPGMDAAISREGRKDLVIGNGRAYPITLKVWAEDWAVHVQVLGQAKPRRRWLRVLPEKRPRPERIIESGSGPESVLDEGADGWKVERYLDWVDNQGNTRSTRLGNDRYDSVRRVIRRPMATPASETTAQP